LHSELLKYLSPTTHRFHVNIKEFSTDSYLKAFEILPLNLKIIKIWIDLDKNTHNDEKKYRKFLRKFFMNDNTTTIKVFNTNNKNVLKKNCENFLIFEINDLISFSSSVDDRFSMDKLFA